VKHFHIHFKKPLLGLTVLLLFAGIFSYTKIKTGLFPDITFPKIKVIADAGQQPVDKMTACVTIPLENAIKRTEGLDYIRSSTSRGSCEISVFLRWSANVDNARLQIESFINEVQGVLLPNTTVTVEKMNPSILPVMGFSLEGNRSNIELKKIALLQIKPFLAATPGVSNIAIIGGKTKEYQLILKPEKLTELHLTPQMISDVVAQSNMFVSNGYLSDYNRLYLTLTDNAIDNRNDLENLVLLNSKKRIVLIKDVADVRIGEMKEYIRINANGKDVPLIAVMKQPDANLIEVNNGVLERVKQLEKILPADLKLKPYYKQADFVNDSISSIRDVLWIGMLLAIFVVLLFLRSAKTSIVVLLTIPLTLALTMVLMYAFGYTFNIMTLGAIAAAVGLMIDDAVIVVEQIHRTHEENPGERTVRIVPETIRSLLPAMVGSSLSTIVIFIPFIMMTGVAGAYFKVLAFTMIITLASSFIITCLALPMMFILFPFKKIAPVRNISSHGKWIRFFIHRPVISIFFALICVFIIILLPPHLPSGFLPDMDEGSIVFDYSSPPGTSLDETDRMLKQVDDILLQQPEVESFSRRIGTEMGFFITEPNRGDALIQLKKKRDKSTEEVSDELRKKIKAAVPQLKIDFGQVIEDMLGDLMSSIQPIEIKIFGDDRKKLEDLSRQTADLIRPVRGTADVFDGITMAGPQIRIEPDVPRLAQLGVTPAEFQFQLQTQIEGKVISKILENQQMVNIRMIYPDALHTTFSKLQDGDILLPGGQLRPISTIATVEVDKGVAQINRENQKMMGIVTARLNERDLGSTLKDIRQTLQKNLSLPSGYHIEYAGSYARQQQAFNELLAILITAALLVFIIMLVLFRNFAIATLVLVVAVLGVAGCMLALLITHTPLNVGSYTGIIMIIGIIGENAIFTCRQYIQAQETMDADVGIVFAIATRLRPKLMTATGAIIALLPLALGIGIGAQLHQPLAIAVIGGLLVALPLLLIVLPSAIRMFRIGMYKPEIE